jgi:hypothetical protein
MGIAAAKKGMHIHLIHWQRYYTTHLTLKRVLIRVIFMTYWDTKAAKQQKFMPVLQNKIFIKKINTLDNLQI